MSQLGAPPSAPPPYTQPSLPPQRPQSSDIPGWVVGVAGIVALALAGALAFVVIYSRTDARTAPPPPRGHVHHYPAHWNHKIAPLAKIAARDRGLRFEHPVPVRFLSPAAFRKSLRSEDGKLTKHDRREISQETAELRALGLLSGKVNLLHASNDASGAEVLAYYSFHDKRITVRGRTITPSIKATLVHELTHVLQDQHFRIGHRLAQLQKVKTSTNDAYEVLDAIVEGDADRVEQIYTDSLTTAQRHALDVSRHHEGAQAKAGVAGIPKVVVAMLQSPYALGIGLTTAAAFDGGNSEVDRLLRHPPVYDASLLDPFRELAGTVGAAHVATPALLSGEKKIDSGEFGAVSLYMTLASRIPATQAMAAADGWGGDAYVAYRRGTTTCMRIAVGGRTAVDTSRIHAALTQWASAAPSGTATVSTVGGRPQVSSCDPGTEVRSGSGNAMAALNLVATRNGLQNGVMHSGTTQQLAHCLSDQLIQVYSVAELNDPTFGQGDPTIETRIHEMALACQ